MAARAASASGCWQYRVADGAAVLTAYVPDGTADGPLGISIPSEIDGLPVREIDSRVFGDYGYGILKITVPGSVQCIHPHAFELCVALEEVVLSEGIEELGEDFLAATAVEELSVPSTVRRIHSIASLPCRLRVDPGNPVYSADRDCIYRKRTLAAVQPFPERGRGAEGSCPAREGTGKSAEDISPAREGTGKSAEGACLVREGTEKIAEGSCPAREGTGKSAEGACLVREGTEKIAEGVFTGRPHIRTVCLPASVTRIPGGVFANEKNPYSAYRGIGEVRVHPDNPVFFREGSGLYERCGDEGLRLHRWFGVEERVELPDGVKEIGRAAFLRCPVREFRAGLGLRTIGEDAFSGCPLASAEFGGASYRVVFPQTNPYLLKDLLRGFGRNGRLYDYSSYDRTLKDWYPDVSRVVMLAARLSWPMGLSVENEQKFRDMLKAHLGDAVRLAAEAGSMEAVELLCGLDIMDAEEADAAMRMVSERGKHEMTARLMEYRRALGAVGFDYSL